MPKTHNPKNINTPPIINEVINILRWVTPASINIRLPLDNSDDTIKPIPMPINKPAPVFP